MDVYAEHELADDPFYRDFLYPNGLGWAAGTHILVPNGDKASINFERPLSEGPISREVIAELNLLRPHLARSLALTARLKQRTLATVTDTLASFGIPACVVNGQRRLKAANELFERFIPSVLLDRRDRVALSLPPSDALLAQALQQSGRAAEGATGSIPLPATDDGPASVLHVLPICGAARDLFSGGLFILAITQLASGAAPDLSLLRGLFDLTPAEARVARLITRGMLTTQIGTELNVSINTVKAHLKSVFAKTGATHQAALVSLLSGLHVPVQTV